MRKKKAEAVAAAKEANKRSKYNVGIDECEIEKRTYDGIIFDSGLEMMYYRDVVLPQMRSGEIVHCELQKRFTLQPKFNNGKQKVQPIYYVADFYLEYADGHTEVVDTKGFPDSVSKIKRKIFWYQNPDINFKWIGFSKKLGGWTDWDIINKERTAAKRLAEKKKKEAQEEKENEQN